MKKFLWLFLLTSCTKQELKPPQPECKRLLWVLKSYEPKGNTYLLYTTDFGLVCGDSLLYYQKYADKFLPICSTKDSGTWILK